MVGEQGEVPEGSVCWQHWVCHCCDAADTSVTPHQTPSSATAKQRPIWTSLGICRGAVVSTSRGFSRGRGWRGERRVAGGGWVGGGRRSGWRPRAWRVILCRGGVRGRGEKGGVRGEEKMCVRVCHGMC